MDGDWEAWIAFFIKGVFETATSTVETAQRLTGQLESDRRRIREHGRAAGSALRVQQALAERPILTMPEACTRTGLSKPTTGRALELLQALGIVRELTGRRRNRLYGYDPYLKVLSEGTEPFTTDEDVSNG